MYVLPPPSSPLCVLQIETSFRTDLMWSVWQKDGGERSRGSAKQRNLKSPEFAQFNVSIPPVEGSRFLFYN